MFTATVKRNIELISAFFQPFAFWGGNILMWKNRFMFREVYYTKNDPAAVFISEFEEIEAVNVMRKLST